MGKASRKRKEQQEYRRPDQEARRLRVPIEGQQIPPAWNPKSQVLQQLGLHTPQGVMRLLTIVMHKVDPMGAGLVITQADVANAVQISTIEGRANLRVVGGADRLELRMCTDEESRAGVHSDNAVAGAQGRPQQAPVVDPRERPPEAP
jgi:hypothetical protein